MLRRNADPAGLQNYVSQLCDGRITPDGVLDEMYTSAEIRSNVRPRNTLRSLHQSRCDFVQLFPLARNILDLGGTDQENDVGSLVSMGYPYDFDELVIVDLPHGDRHDLYNKSARIERIESARGPVRYEYHSMVDLSRYKDASFDLVVSGQTIEHITRDEANVMLAEVYRVVTSGGWFCVDTPNRRVTAIENPSRLTNPDHKIEYTHEQLHSVLTENGFEVVYSFGLNYVGESVAKGIFSPEEMAANWGLYSQITDCYVLAYMCRKPS
jgi:SAM-dependent methyltransferase